MAERDVELVIRARDEANKVIKNFAAGLKDLAGIQDDVSKSAGKVDSVLASLGSEFANLNTQVQGLKAFGRVVSDMDKAAAAVDRLDANVGKINGELAGLAAKQQAAAAATLQAKAAAEQAAAAFTLQSTQAKEVAKAAGRTSEAYLAQKVALDAARESRVAANQTATRAAAEEDKLQKKMVDVSSELANQKVSLVAAQSAWQELYTASQKVGSTLGGVAASQEAIATAAGHAAEKLNLVKGAVDFTRTAAEAKRLRDAADYVDFWTQALERKQKAEALVRGSINKDLLGVQDQVNQSTGVGRQSRSAQVAALSFEGLFKAQDAKEAADALRDAARAEDQMAASAARLRAQIDPLAAVNDKLSQELREIEALFKLEKISANEYGQAIKLVGQRAKDAAENLGHANLTGGKGTLFGLKPYELHSLSYQVNDVFTQLGSGTPVMQVLAQQGGQVFQVFQRQLIPAISRIGPTLAAASPFIIVVAAALGTVVAALKNVADRAASVKEFGATLAASADGALYSAQGMADAAHKIDVYGGSLEDARKAVKAFNAAGIDQSQFVRFGKTAKDLADVTGIALPEAAKKLADGFSGGWKQVDELDKSLNFLTASEYAHLKSMADSGRTSQALTEAYAILERKQSDAAAKMRGPWAEATRNLGGAWDRFLESIGNSKPITKTLGVLSDLLKLIKKATDLLPGNESLDQLLGMRADKQRSVDSLQGSFFGNIGGLGRKSPAQIAAEQLAELDARIAAKRLEEAAKLNEIRNDGSEDAEKAGIRAVAAAQKELDVAKGLTEEKRVQNAYDEARQKAEDEGASKAKAAEAGRLAAAAERLRIEKENTKESTKQLKDAVDLDKVQGQAFLATANQYAGRSENNAADNNVLQNLFKQAGQDVDPKMTAWCAAFVNAVLATNGLPGTGKLNARSFLNYGKEASTPQQGDIVVLKRGKNPDQGHVGFYQGQDEKGNVKVLGGNTGDKVGTGTFPASDVLSYRRAPTPAGVEKERLDLLEKLQEAQEAYRQSFNSTLDLQLKDVEIQKAQTAGNEQLVRTLTINKQVEQELAQARKAGIPEDEIQGYELAMRAVAEATYDATNAERLLQAQQVASEKPVNELLERRSLLQQQITFAQQQGDNGTAATLKTQLQGVNVELQGAIDRAIAMWKAIGGPEADNAILKLQGAKAEVQAVGQKAVITGDQANEMIGTGLAGAFDSFAQKVAAGENAFQAAGDAFRQFASDFLRQIAQMIIKQAILNAIGGASGGGGGVGGAIASAIGSLFHEGGVVGQGGQPRAVSPSWFSNAARYHTGGIVGLKPNEVPAVLEKNEEVLTTSDPRHQFNGGGGGNTVVPAPQIKIVNAIDAGDMVQQGLNTSVGEKAILNLVRNNPGAFKQAMGG